MEPDPDRGAQVTLREITSETVRAICRLAVAPDQSGLVSPNALSIAEAHYEPKAWVRAIYAGDAPVGFVMLYLDPGATEYFLWRFMIDARFQRRGFGRRAIAAVIEHVRGLPGATELWVSYRPAEGNPEPFYRRLGFEPTGREVEGEPMLRLTLARSAEAEQDARRSVPDADPSPPGVPVPASDRPAPPEPEPRPEPASVVRPSAHAPWSPGKMGKWTLFASDRLLVGLNAFEPGQEHGLHAHAGTDKLYHVLEGAGLFLLDGRELPMRAGELLVAPEGVPHGIRNPGPDRLLVLAVLAPAPH
jgi:diamine N-acetyltransferase